MPRTIAIGDIHGCLLALERLLAEIRPTAEDTVVALGDYVDRGPDSRGAIEALIELGRRTQLVPLLGNHEEMLLKALERPDEVDGWLMYGGRETLDSYGLSAIGPLPEAHLCFLHACRDYYETDTHIFLHASYVENKPLEELDALWLRWESLRDYLPGPHFSGKTAIVGHTAQRSGEILDAGHLKCIDTYCYGGGWLTALDVDSGQVWQADELGRLRGETLERVP